MSSSRRKMTEVGDSRPGYPPSLSLPPFLPLSLSLSLCNNHYFSLKGVYTRYKPHISKDKLFIKLLQTKVSVVSFSTSLVLYINI